MESSLRRNSYRHRSYQHRSENETGHENIPSAVGHISRNRPGHMLSKEIHYLPERKAPSSESKTDSNGGLVYFGNNPLRHRDSMKKMWPMNPSPMNSDVPPSISASTHHLTNKQHTPLSSRHSARQISTVKDDFDKMTLGIGSPRKVDSSELKLTKSREEGKLLAHTRALPRGGEGHERSKNGHMCNSTAPSITKYCKIESPIQLVKGQQAYNTNVDQSKDSSMDRMQPDISQPNQRQENEIVWNPVRSGPVSVRKWIHKVPNQFGDKSGSNRSSVITNPASESSFNARRNFSDSKTFHTRTTEESSTYSDMRLDLGRTRRRSRRRKAHRDEHRLPSNPFWMDQRLKGDTMMRTSNRFSPLGEMTKDDDKL